MKEEVPIKDKEGLKIIIMIESIMIWIENMMIMDITNSVIVKPIGFKIARDKANMTDITRRKMNIIVGSNMMSKGNLKMITIIAVGTNTNTMDIYSYKTILPNIQMTNSMKATDMVIIDNTIN